MLLAEGLNIKVMLLPEGEDPDSFAQSHTLEEITDYMNSNETDFLRFKTDILLKDVNGNDPIARSRVITSIVRSISVIPDEVIRNEYVKECSRLLSANESTIALQVARFRNEAAEARQKSNRTEQSSNETMAVEATVIRRNPDASTADRSSFMRPYETETLRLVLKYGMVHLCDAVDAEGNTSSMNVLEYVDSELRRDDLTFSNPDLLSAYRAACGLQESWRTERHTRQMQLQAESESGFRTGMDMIRRDARTVIEAQKMESDLKARTEAYINDGLADFDELFISRALASDPDDTVRKLVTTLVSEKYVLSKIHTKHSRIETERDCLQDRVPKSVYGWKNAVLECREKELRADLAKAVADNDHDRVLQLMTEQQQLRQIIADLAKYLGERIVLPRRS